MNLTEFSTPLDPVVDKLQRTQVQLRDDASSCSYQGNEFGASYPDSVCIGGYLWDADSGWSDEDGWNYTSGGEIACPHCNHKTWLEAAVEEIREDGYNHDGSVADCRYPEKARFAHCGDLFKDAWLEGFNRGKSEDTEEESEKSLTT